MKRNKKWLFVLAGVFAAAIAQELSNETKNKISQLKAQKMEALRLGDEASAEKIQAYIDRLKTGAGDVSEQQIKDATIKPAASKYSAEDKLLFKESEVRSISKSLDSKRSDKVREELLKLQKDEYVARGLFLDGRKAIVRGDYEMARKMLDESIAIQEEDEPKTYRKLLYFPTANIASTKSIFSILRDKKLSLTASVTPNEKGVKDWTKKWLVEVRHENSAENVFMQEGTEKPPAKFEWDGKLANGKYTTEGKYVILMTLQGDYFTKFVRSNTFEISENPPSVQLSIEPESFVAGAADITIKLDFEDATQVANWKVTVINQSSNLIKTFAMTAAKELIIWDGKDEAGNNVREGETLTFRIEGTDILGKSWKGNTDTLFSDIKIENNAFTLNNIVFETGKAALKGESLPVLDVVVNLLMQKSWYSIQVLGHTDDVGADDFNLKLSRSRAESVVKYLSSKGIAKDRLTFEGMGETAPIAENSTETGKARNRRVEFKLNEDEQKKLQFYEQKRKEAIMSAKQQDEERAKLKAEEKTRLDAAEAAQIEADRKAAEETPK